MTTDHEMFVIISLRIALEDDDSLVNSRGEGGKTALHIAVLVMMCIFTLAYIQYIH